MSDPIKAASDISKATEEVAKAAGKAIDATRDLGSFVGKFIREPLDHVSGMVSDRLAYMRYERQLRLMRRVEQLQGELGVTVIRPLPMKLAIPLFQGASLEEDDGLQDRWAALLVNATDDSRPIELTRTIISILEHLSPLDAFILDKIYDMPYEESKRRGVWTALLPEKVVLGAIDSIWPAEVEDRHPTDDVALSLANLSRLGCLTADALVDGGESFSRVSPTLMGKSFVEACRAKS